jgi:hypothetical protein
MTHMEDMGTYVREMWLCSRVMGVSHWMVEIRYASYLLAYEDGKARVF